MGSFIPHEPLESYQARFKDHFILTRGEDGVLEARMHSDGGEALWGYEKHRALGQLFNAVGMDRENELLILTGTDPNWLMNTDTASFKNSENTPDEFRETAYEKLYRDTKLLVESILSLDFPTIGVLNGPGYHTEPLLMCDLTLCSEDAVFFDPHYERGSVPGDGQFLAFQQLVGIKRANFMALTGQRVDAATALEWGLVNEVLPAADLMPRARELAASILQAHPTARRTTSHVLRRPWRRAYADDFDVHLTHEIFSLCAVPLEHRKAKQSQTHMTS